MNKFIVTIGREFGSGGRQIAMKLAELLQVKVYDRRLLEQLQERYQLTEEQINAIKGKKKSWWADFARFYQQAMIWAESRDTGAFKEDVTSQQLYDDEEFILRSLAEQESCIILGRTGFHIFRDAKNVLKVFLIADRAYRRDKVARRLNINEGSADALIDKVDEARENFTQSFSGKSRYDAHNYDLVINVTGMEPQDVALMIADCVKCKLKQGK